VTQLWSNTCKKNSKIQKTQKLTRVIDFNTIWSKLTTSTKWNIFKKIKIKLRNFF